MAISSRSLAGLRLRLSKPDRTATHRQTLHHVDIIVILGPIFLTIALGAVLQRAGFFAPDFLSGANKLTYWVGLPVLVLISLVDAEHGKPELGRLLPALVVATLLSIVLAWVTARLVGVKPGGEGTWTQAAFRGNLVFVGLPLVLAMPDIPRTAAILSMAPLLVVYNGGSVALLLVSRHRGNLEMGRMVMREIVRNPIVIASVVGGIVYLLNGSLWLPVGRTLSQIAKMSVPLALICIGGALVTTPFRGNRRVAVYAALFKTAVSPLVGYGVGRLLGLNAGEMRVVLVLMACPTAAVSYTMVRQLGGDENVAASSIVLSTLFSMIALSVVLAVA